MQNHQSLACLAKTFSNVPSIAIALSLEAYCVLLRLALMIYHEISFHVVPSDPSLDLHFFSFRMPPQLPPSRTFLHSTGCGMPTELPSVVTYRRQLTPFLFRVPPCTGSGDNLDTDLGDRCRGPPPLGLERLTSRGFDLLSSLGRDTLPNRAFSLFSDRT